MKIPVQVSITPEEAEKFVRTMGRLGKPTYTKEIGPEAHAYRFRDARDVEAGYFVEIDYPRRKASITIDAG